jgi:hypothetical protein
MARLDHISGLNIHGLAVGFCLSNRGHLCNFCLCTLGFCLEEMEWESSAREPPTDPSHYNSGLRFREDSARYGGQHFYLLYRRGRFQMG